jgi:hypothetical protein
MRGNVPPNYLLHVGVQGFTCPAVPLHFGRRISHRQMALAALLGVVLPADAYGGTQRPRLTLKWRARSIFYKYLILLTILKTLITSDSPRPPRRIAPNAPRL